MIEFTPNQIVLLPCRMIREKDDRTYQVSVETGDQPVEGRVNADTLMTYGNGQVYARAVVMQIKRRSITVWIPGAFTNSDGRLQLPRAWATAHAREYDARENNAFAGPIGERKLPPYWGHGWFYEA